MEKTIYDKSNGLWCELRGEFYVPCLKLPAYEEGPIFSRQMSWHMQ